MSRSARRLRAHPVLGWAAALVLLLAGPLLAAACGGDAAAPTLEVTDEEEPADHEYVIPYGTMKRIRGGEEIEIMPPELDVTVGETIRITNDDASGAFVGIFYVGAGETVRMKFTTPGVLSGKCEVSSSGEFTINVHEA